MNNAGVTRRDFVKTVGATVISVGLAGRANADVAQSPPLTYLSATKLAHLIASREVSAEEVAEAYLARIEVVNPKINAIFQIDPKRILAEARQADSDLKSGVNRGPLHGVPFSMKDQLLTQGMITTNGCPELTWVGVSEGHHTPVELLGSSQRIVAFLRQECWARSRHQSRIGMGSARWPGMSRIWG